MSRASEQRQPKDADDGPVRIFGIHAVEAALRNPARRLHKLWLTENAQNRLGEALQARGLAAVHAEPRDLDRLIGGETVHQGVLVEADLLAEPSLDEVVALALTPGAGPLVVLDQVTDPHNVGAILRSAAAFGAAGLVMTRRNSPPLAGVLAKSASGALEHVPVALVSNLAQALGRIREAGLHCVGLDGEAEEAIERADLAGPTALVLGAEGRGLRRLTRELCDRLCRISTPGALASLNVSNAAAVALHAVAAARLVDAPLP